MRRKRMKSKCVSSGTMRSDGSRSKHGDHGQHGNQDAEPDENELSHSGSVPQIGTVLRPLPPHPAATIRRVRVKAVKTVVMMPMPSVTAKPRTGPVPI